MSIEYINMPYLKYRNGEVYDAAAIAAYIKKKRKSSVLNFMVRNDRNDFKNIRLLHKTWYCRIQDKESKSNEFDSITYRNNCIIGISHR